MSWLSFLFSLLHLVGLVLAVGAATVKVALLLKCRADSALVPGYLRFVRSVTRLIIVGLILLILSGIGWLLLGYPFTVLLIVKIGLVVPILVLGPLIDNVVEPKFRNLAPAAGEAASPAFHAVQNQYLAVEIIATLLFYVIISVWLLR